MQNAMIGWQNVLQGATFTNDAATYTGFPASNMALDVGGAGYSWRVLSGGFRSFGATLPAPASVRVLSLHRTNLSSASVFRIQFLLSGSVVYDTGNITPGVIAGQMVFVLPAAFTVDNIVLFVRDPAGPDVFLSIGFAFAGPVFQPARNWTMDAGWGSKAQVDGFTTRNGLLFPQYRYRNRTLKLPWNNFLPAEMADVEQMIAVADTARNVLVIPNPDVLTASPLPLFGQLAAADRGLVQGGYRSSTFTVTERL